MHMDRSDYYIAPGKAEAAALCRAAASRSKTLAESEDKDDRAAAPAYDLVFDAWRSMHDGVEDAATAVAALRASGREQGLDPALIEAVIEEMERVLLRGYKDTLMAAPAKGAAPKEFDAGPELFARPQPLAEILGHQMRAQAGQPAPAPDPDAADQADRERVLRESAQIALAAQGLTVPRGGRRAR
jgi:hypothetical protein